MSKRRKKSTQTREPDIDFASFEKEKRQMMAIIQEKFASGEFESAEDANAMLASFTGRPMGEIIAEHQTSKPPSKYERAMRHLDKIEEARSESAARKIAKTASGIDPDCVEAWMEMAATYESPKLAEKYLRKAVAAGERKHADLIGQVKGQDEPWLWGHVEARPFLEAQAVFGNFFETTGRVQEATAIYEKILSLNINDNQGIRTALLRCFIMRGDDAGVKRLRKNYDGERSAVWLYLVALHLYSLAAEESGWFPEPPADDATMGEVLNSFAGMPADFEQANQAFDAAFKANRFAPFFIADARTQSLSIQSYALGSPAEAVHCARESQLLWPVTGAFLWLFTKLEQATSAEPLHYQLKGLDRDQLDELLNFHEQLGEMSLENTDVPKEVIAPATLSEFLREELLEPFLEDDPGE